MRIVADENIPLAEEFFAGLGTLQRLHGRTLSKDQVRDADVLLVRSVTPVNQALLEGSRVRFVGTATIGTDHVDREYLAERGIGFASAPGCNADSVADYVIASLLTLAEREGVSLLERCVGIIGVGNVGSRVSGRLEAMGITCLRNDPPRAAAGATGLVGLDEILERADILCLHTPLIVDGPWPTQHLLGRHNLARLKPGAWLLNAGRGGAIDNQALKEHLQCATDLRVVLDVWEPEPGIDPELAHLVDLATPHIAGYSQEGRMRGTEMLYQALCEFLGRPVERSLADLLPAAPVTQVELAADAQGQSLLSRLVRLCYDPLADDLRLRRTLGMEAKERALAFDHLRKHYPPRREISTLRVLGGDVKLREQLRGCGFGSD